MDIILGKVGEVEDEVFRWKKRVEDNMAQQNERNKNSRNAVINRKQYENGNTQRNENAKAADILQHLRSNNTGPMLISKPTHTSMTSMSSQEVVAAAGSINLDYLKLQLQETLNKRKLENVGNGQSNSVNDDNLVAAIALKNKFQKVNVENITSKEMVVGPGIATEVSTCDITLTKRKREMEEEQKGQKEQEGDKATNIDVNIVGSVYDVSVSDVPSSSSFVAVNDGVGMDVEGGGRDEDTLGGGERGPVSYGEEVQGVDGDDVIDDDEDGDVGDKLLVVKRSAAEIKDDIEARLKLKQQSVIDRNKETITDKVRLHEQGWKDRYCKD